MDPFSIICTTCKSRLKVRSAAAIGQVVSCPKCGGMVLVKSPDEGVPPEVASAATKPVEQQGERANPDNTKDFDDIESALAGVAAVPVAAVSRGELPRGNDFAPPAVAAPAVEPSAVEPSAAEPSAAPVPATAATSKRAIEPPRVGQRVDVAPPSPPAPLTRRYALWLALSIVMGIALATAVVIAGSLLRGRGELVAKSPPAPEPTPTKSADARPAASTDSDPPIVQGHLPPRPLVSKTLPEPATKAPAAPTSAPKVKPNEQGDPLGIVELPQAAGKTDKPPVAIGEDPLGKFGQVLGSGNDNPLPTPEAPPATATNVEESTEGAAPAAPRPAPRTVDVEARLADPLVGIDVPGVPLADFLADLSSLSTIPITLEPEGLPLVGLSAATPVSLRAENTTIGQALDSALAPLHLERRTLDDQVIVGLSGRLSDRSFPVDDLTGRSEEQAQQLAEWATALVDPAVWKEGDEEGPLLTPGAEQFAVRASDQTYAGLLLLMEKLRVARGQALRTKQPADVFRLESRSARANAKLSALISLNFSQPTLLVIIVRRLEKDAQLRILVDWRALAAEGWNADGEGTLSVQDKPLAEALTELLKPMDLTWRAIDDQTVQLTTLAALRQTLELEVYPVGKLAADLAQGDALLAKLRRALALEEEEAGSALRFDPISNSVLASLPQPQQQQLERLLAEWKK